MSDTIRILIADDHPVVREGLVRLLSRQKDMVIIGQAANGEEACQLYDRLFAGHSPSGSPDAQEGWDRGY